jgi:hypothetical protein
MELASLAAERRQQTGKSPRNLAKGSSRLAKAIIRTHGPAGKIGIFKAAYKVGAITASYRLSFRI